MVYYTPIISQMDVIFREDMNKSLTTPDKSEESSPAPRNKEEKLLRWAKE